MNPSLLVAHFDRISDAPAAIPRLRRFVLDLAARGKLLDQNPDDDPASRLIERLGAKQPRPARAKQIIKQRAACFANGEMPSEIPANWIWVQLGDICSKTGSGSTPRGGKSVYQRDGVPFLRSQNVYDDGLRLDDVGIFLFRPTKRCRGQRSYRVISC